MPTNIFSPMVKGQVGHMRRMYHTLSQYFSAHNPFAHHTSSVAVAESVVSQASNVAGAIGVVGGALAIAGSAIAGAAIFAAVAGPHAAITAGIVGLALAVKSTYSNRDAAHIKLYQYTWNMVDDEAPTLGVKFSKESLEDAACAASTLLTDGQNQITLLGTKYSAAKKRFDDFNTELNKKNKNLVEELDKINAMPEFTLRNVGSLQQKIPNAGKKLRQEVYKNDKERLKALWTSESIQGGAIFNYIRRCSHVGNYLQAPHILSLAMRAKFDNGEVLAKEHKDFFEGMNNVKLMREDFTKLAESYRKMDFGPGAPGP